MASRVRPFAMRCSARFSTSSYSRKSGGVASGFNLCAATNRRTALPAPERVQSAATTTEVSKTTRRIIDILYDVTYHKICQCVVLTNQPRGLCQKDFPCGELIQNPHPLQRAQRMGTRHYSLHSLRLRVTTPGFELVWTLWNSGSV